MTIWSLIIFGPNRLRLARVSDDGRPDELIEIAAEAPDGSLAKNLQKYGYGLTPSDVAWEAAMMRNKASDPGPVMAIKAANG